MTEALYKGLRRVCVMAVVIASVMAPDRAGAQAAVEIVSTTGEIPRASFKSWSIFLVCNPDWVSPEKSGDLANLYRRFKSFGDAIGRDNLAVWFWKRQAPLNNLVCRKMLTLRVVPTIAERSGFRRARVLISW